MKRNTFVDIVKALGIISIVIGHSSWYLPEIFNFPIGPFVYTYHLMLFLFVAGFCFKKESIQNVGSYIGKRIMSLVPLVVVYNTIFTIAHNAFIKANLIADDPITGFAEILTRIFQGFTLNVSESLLGAFWFVPMLLFAHIFFVLLFARAEKLPCPLFWHLLFIICCGSIGIYACTKNLIWPYRIHLSVLGIPVMYAGYFFKVHWDKIQRFFYLGGVSVICAAVICYVLNRFPYIELSINSIMSPVLFYPVTMLGIAFCLGIAKLIEKMFLSKFFAYIGRNSFHIMALHFLSFKIVDLIYGSYYHIGAETISTFPHAFEIWPIYYLTGVLLPLGIVSLIKVFGSAIGSAFNFSRYEKTGKKDHSML